MLRRLPLPARRAFRLSLATATPDLREGAERLVRAVSTWS